MQTRPKNPKAKKGLAYTYWEVGRDSDDGKFVSMKPVEPKAEKGNLGSIDLGEPGLGLSEIAEFGNYLEFRKLNSIREAEFEERRNTWLKGITDQWIQEHQTGVGIRRDVTLAVAKECEKLFEAIKKNGNVDVSQTLLLRLQRMSEFLEWNYAALAWAIEFLVEDSGSDPR